MVCKSYKFMSPFMVTVLILLLSLKAFSPCICLKIHENIITRIESEKHSLLKFKQDLQDPSNMLADWTDSKGDCCNWVGVVCHNVTGHVIELHLRRLKLGGKLNPTLLDLRHLSYLDLSKNDFGQAQLPVWFWNLTSNSHLKYLNISRNQFIGNIPDLLATKHPYVVLDFSCNKFTGLLPRISSNVTAFDVTNNAMSGSISYFLCHRSKHHEVRKKLEVLNLANNNFSGEIPDCWEKWSSLVAIKLCDNNFSGKIPSSMGALASLRSLHLRNNSLVGELPSSLRNCAELLTLDLGANQLSGEIPPWMGDKLSKLIIISLQANMLQGHIPEKICALSSLQILDLSRNSLAGTIPSCISNLTAMVSRIKNGTKIPYNTSSGICFLEIIKLVMKGMVLDYSTILNLITILDLSDNNLSGEIPTEVTSLTGLLSLNLSKNHLIGKIPDNIGDMGSLECVDLSENNLSGGIPESMSKLTFLSYLNVSSNKLTGRIPLGTQLQSFNVSSYWGTKLFGPPLTKISLKSMASRDIVDDNGTKVKWFVISPEVGFCFGLLGVIGPIVYSKSLRAKYFQYLDYIAEKFHRSLL